MPQSWQFQMHNLNKYDFCPPAPRLLLTPPFPTIRCGVPVTICTQNACLKSIAELIETGTLHKYAKLRHAISIFGDGKCFALEDVIMLQCNSNCSQGLLRSQKIPRKIGNNAYGIRPNTHIVFPLYCMRCSVHANARQRHKMTFRHLQYQQLFAHV